MIRHRSRVLETGPVRIASYGVLSPTASIECALRRPVPAENRSPYYCWLYDSETSPDVPSSRAIWNLRLRLGRIRYSRDTHDRHRITPTLIIPPAKINSILNRGLILEGRDNAVWAACVCREYKTSHNIGR